MWRLILGLAGVLGVASLLDDKKDSKPRKASQRRKHKSGGKRKMADKKVVFVAFAIEDERQRDFLVGQSLNTATPFEFVDMSVKEPYDEAWKERVRTRIKRSDGLIALVSSHSLSSSGQKWEIACAKEEGKKVLGVWAYKDDRTNLAGVNTIVWTWDGISKFIDSL